MSKYKSRSMSEVNFDFKSVYLETMRNNGVQVQDDSIDTKLQKMQKAKSLNKPAGFDARLQYSIRLLRKAQKLALTYDSDDGFFLAFSGGKDSQALYHVAKLAGVRFRAHMNFTSVDPPQVIRFVRTCYPDVITHAPVKSIFALAVDRGILPSMRIRWCCADLKESASAGKVTLIGIRKQESTRRAKRHEIEVSGKRFSGDFDQFKKWQRKTISAKEAALLREYFKDNPYYGTWECPQE